MYEHLSDEELLEQYSEIIDLILSTSPELKKKRDALNVLLLAEDDKRIDQASLRSEFKRLHQRVTQLKAVDSSVSQMLFAIRREIKHRELDVLAVFDFNESLAD